MFLVRIQGERARWIVRVQAHPPQRNHIRYRRNQNLTVVLEADEPTVKKMVGGRGKEQAVCTVEAFLDLFWPMVETCSLTAVNRGNSKWMPDFSFAFG